MRVNLDQMLRCTLTTEPHDDLPFESLSIEDSIRLVARFQNGDDQAAGKLFRRHVEQLVRLTQSRISTRLVRRIDAEDVVQSVYGDFFEGAKKGNYILERSGDLWRLLVGITMNKLRKQFEFHAADKRDYQREQNFGGDDSTGQAEWQPPSPDASHPEIIAIVDQLEHFLQKLKPSLRSILELRLQGHSVQEIAEYVQLSDRHVRRELENVRELLEREMVPPQ